MDKQYFIQLLHQYQLGNLTIEEQQFIESYYNQFQDDPDIFETLNAGEKEELGNSMKDAIWSHILRKEAYSQKKRFFNKRFTRMGAAAVIFIVVIAGSFFLFNGISNKQATGSTAVQQKENRVIFLPDGSTVFLSTGSKLSYPSSFDGMEKREVFLTGQAFFDIKHNVSKTFIVHTEKLETIVMGTAFNIRAIPAEPEIIVTVKRGKVKVNDHHKTLGVFTPKQQITYNKKKVSSVIKVVYSDNYLDWKEQDLLFDNVTIAEAAKLLEEEYKVKIEINDPSIGSQHFTTTFSKNAGLEQVLKSICVFNEVAYKYDKEKAIVIISR